MNEAQYNRLVRRVEALEAREGALEAIFVDTAATDTDHLHVTIAAYDDGEHVFGPVKWAPIGETLPQAGDEALVIESNEGRWWAIAWSPS